MFASSWTGWIYRSNPSKWASGEYRCHLQGQRQVKPKDRSYSDDEEGLALWLIGTFYAHKALQVKKHLFAR